MINKDDNINFKRLVKLFRAAGGVIENISLGSGPRGRGLFVIDPTCEACLVAPRSLYLPVDEIVMRENRPYIRETANLPDSTREFFDAYYASSIGFPETVSRDAKRAITDKFCSPKDLQKALLEGADGDSMYVPYNTNLVFDWYISQRFLTTSKGVNILIPMLELINHSECCEPYRESGVGIEFRGFFKDECLIRYSTFDCWTKFLVWGFVEPAVNVMSLGITLTDPSGLRVRVIPDGHFQDSDHFTEFSMIDGELFISRLLLDKLDYTDYASDLFQSKIQPFNVLDAAELFNNIKNFNIAWYRKIISLSKQGQENYFVYNVSAAAQIQLGRLLL